MSTSLHEIAQVEAAQVQPTVEAYGKIYFTIRRATETRRPEEGRQNQNPEWSDGEGTATSTSFWTISHAFFLSVLHTRRSRCFLLSAEKGEKNLEKKKGKR